MKRLLQALALAALALPALAGHLDGVLPLAADDKAAVAQVAGTPGRHALLFFGDHAN
jgi:hypothetical protein